MKVETEKEGLKAVVTQIAQGQAQDIGAVKQKILDLEKMMRELRYLAFALRTRKRS